MYYNYYGEQTPDQLGTSTYSIISVFTSTIYSQNGLHGNGLYEGYFKSCYFLNPCGWHEKSESREVCVWV